MIGVDRQATALGAVQLPVAACHNTPLLVGQYRMSQPLPVAWHGDEDLRGGGFQVVAGNRQTGR
jgi:hypothetical protein